MLNDVLPFEEHSLFQGIALSFFITNSYLKNDVKLLLFCVLITRYSSINDVTPHCPLLVQLRLVPGLSAAKLDAWAQKFSDKFQSLNSRLLNRTAMSQVTGIHNRGHDADFGESPAAAILANQDVIIANQDIMQANQRYVMMSVNQLKQGVKVATTVNELTTDNDELSPIKNRLVKSLSANKSKMTLSKY